MDSIGLCPALVTESSYDAEDLAYRTLHLSRQKLIDTIYETSGNKAFSTSSPSDNDILVFIHSMKTFGINPSAEGKILEAFQDYSKAYESYRTHFQWETSTSTRQELCSIDPHLVGKSRYNQDDFFIVKGLKFLFYEVVNWTSKTQIDRYENRMSVLEPEKEREEQTQKVIDIFSRFFRTSEPVTSIQDITNILSQELFERDATLQGRKKWFENYLEIHVHSNLDYLLRQEVSLDKFEKPAIIFDEEELNFTMIDAKNPAVVPVEASSWGAALYARVKSITRYFFSNLASISHNLWSSKTLLTSDTVLLCAPDTSKIKSSPRIHPITKMEELEELKQNIHKQLKEDETDIKFIHTPTSMVIPHSTMLAVVTKVNENGEKENVILFFDPRGNHPKDAKLLHPLEGVETVQDFYEKIVEGLEKPPQLLYNSTSIQGDVLSCTAYSAVFMEEACRAVKSGENLTKFMQDVSNSNVVTYLKARRAVSLAQEKLSQDSIPPESSDSESNLLTFDEDTFT